MKSFYLYRKRHINADSVRYATNDTIQNISIYRRARVKFTLLRDDMKVNSQGSFSLTFRLNGIV